MIRFMDTLLVVTLAAAVGLAFDIAAVSAGPDKTKQAETDCGESESRSKDIAEKYGIEPLQIRLTGAGHFLDFRYRVMDAEKAKPILSRNAEAFLVDQESGKVLPVPVTKIGSMRGTTLAPKEGRQYFILFANANKTIDRGSRVTVVIDEIRLEGLIVQ